MAIIIENPIYLSHFDVMCHRPLWVRMMFKRDESE